MRCCRELIFTFEFLIAGGFQKQLRSRYTNAAHLHWRMILEFNVNRSEIAAEDLRYLGGLTHAGLRGGKPFVHSLAQHFVTCFLRSRQVPSCLMVSNGRRIKSQQPE